MDEKFVSFFPYPEFKPQQLPVMEFVSGVVEKSEIGLVEAYCGFGKTISTFAPVFEAGKKVLLLSPTHTARNAGIAEALRINKEKEKQLMVADLRSKSTMCFLFPKNQFSYEACWRKRKFKECPFFRSTYFGKDLSPKAKKAISEAKALVFNKPEQIFPDDDMKKEPRFFKAFGDICGQNGVCFYETMKHVVEKADVVVLDYNWCFTEIFALLKLLIDAKDFVLLVDEADALVDRLYNNLHAKVTFQGVKDLVSQARRILKDEEEFGEDKKTLNEADVQFLKDFSKYTVEILQDFPPERAISPEKLMWHYLSGFKQTLQEEGLASQINFDDIIRSMKRVTESIDSSDGAEKAKFRPHLFLKKLSQVRGSEKHLTFIPKSQEGIYIKPFEMKSELLLSGLTAVETLKQFHSAILFSATIGDERLFMEEFGLGRENTKVFKLNHMPHKKLILLIDTELDSTFKKRKVNAPKYVEKVKTLLAEDTSLIVSCCNQVETDQLIEAIPEMANGQESTNLDAEKPYAINIRTKHARSTNKARKIRNCIIVGLPLPDYSDFYFKHKRDYLERKYGKEHAGKLLNKKAVDNAVQSMGRITRDLKSPKAMVLADKRFEFDFFLKKFYGNSLPAYLRPYAKAVNNNRELKNAIHEFWNPALDK